MSDVCEKEDFLEVDANNVADVGRSAFVDYCEDRNEYRIFGLLSIKIVNMIRHRDEVFGLLKGSLKGLLERYVGKLSMTDI